MRERPVNRQTVVNLLHIRSKRLSDIPDVAHDEPDDEEHEEGIDTIAVLHHAQHARTTATASCHPCHTQRQHIRNGNGQKRIAGKGLGRMAVQQGMDGTLHTTAGTAQTGEPAHRTTGEQRRPAASASRVANGIDHHEGKEKEEQDSPYPPAPMRTTGC